jgi:multicomponent Na+:H+ antiporter subunit D
MSELDGVIAVLASDPLASWLPVLPLLLPLLTVAVVVVLWGQERAQGITARVGLVLTSLASGGLLAVVATNGPLSVSVGGWPAPFGIAVVGDLFGALLSFVASVLVTVLAFSISTQAREDDNGADPGRRHRKAGLWALIVALLAGSNGAFLTGDLFNLYVWFEVTLIASFGLLVLGGGREQIDGAVKYAFLNLMATTLLLIGIGLLYGVTGTLNMADLGHVLANAQPGWDILVIGLMIGLAFAMKAAVFPLGFWLPAAYHTPFALVAALFAGLLTKVGIYSLYRTFTLVFVPEGEVGQSVAAFLPTLAIATLILAGMGAVAERDIRRLAAWTVVAGVGVMLSGLAIGSAQALGAGTFYMLQSMAAAAAFFLIVGLAVQRAQSSELKAMGGLYRSAPWLAVLFFVCSLSLAGVPPLSGFWPKAALVQAGLAAGEPGVVAALLVSGFLVLFALMRAFALAFWRPKPEGAIVSAEEAAASAGRPSRRGLVTAGALVLASAIVGLWPEPVLRMSLDAGAGLQSYDTYVERVLKPAEAEGSP